jgi:hypothetical protein
MVLLYVISSDFDALVSHPRLNHGNSGMTLCCSSCFALCRFGLHGNDFQLIQHFTHYPGPCDHACISSQSYRCCNTVLRSSESCPRYPHKLSNAC